jgi:uncharacterized protein (DUF488 family)
MASLPVVWTVGHSTRTLETLAGLVREHGVTTVADVRTVPRSRHNPQWNRDGLADALGVHGLRYVHLPELGGLRHPRRDSVNTGLRNAGFRGYADYMQTEMFEESLAALVRRARSEAVAVMCAEAVPWRCHRSLIADALTARGIRVEHIVGVGPSPPHTLHAAARIDGTRVTYPPEAPPLPGLLRDDVAPRPRNPSRVRRARAAPRRGRGAD